MYIWIVSGVAGAAHMLARTDIGKTVVKTKDSFLQGLRNGDANSWSIVLIAAIVIVGGGLAGWYFKNR